MNTLLGTLAAIPQATALALFAMAILLYGAIAKPQSNLASIRAAALGLAIAGLWFLLDFGQEAVAPIGGYTQDDLVRYAALLICFAAAVSLLLGLPRQQSLQLEGFEYPVLTLLSVVGMLLMVSAHSWLGLYLGLELQSLALYVLAAYRRESAPASEAGLKYFLLGALSSGLLLYGISLLYGYTGVLGFTEAEAALAARVAEGEALPLGLTFGLIFVMAGLAFKISAVPFHMWTPDVYQGAPTPVTAFFATAPKVAAFILVARVLLGPLAPLQAAWVQIVTLLALASMLWGALAAIQQSNIKRLMAYSSIGHMGFALVGLAVGSEVASLTPDLAWTGLAAVLVYLTTYLVMNLGTFALILAMQRDGTMVEQITDLAGLWQHQPSRALALLVIMFSMAGIPPFIGFFGKALVFYVAAQSGEILFVTLAVAGLLTSVISAFYYLRLVKIAMLDGSETPLDTASDPIHRWVMALSTLFILALPLLGLLLWAATQAANGFLGA